MKNLLIALGCALIALSSCTSGEQKATVCPHDKADMEMVLNIEQKIKPEHVSAFINSFLKCKVETMKEPGCLDYNIYRSTVDTCIVFIAETWKNEGEWKKHSETAHLKVHSEEVKGMRDSSYKGAFQKLYLCPDANK